MIQFVYVCTRRFPHLDQAAVTFLFTLRFQLTAAKRICSPIQRFFLGKVTSCYRKNWLDYKLVSDLENLHQSIKGTIREDNVQAIR